MEGEAGMDDDRRRVVAWVGRDILPHEADVRAWLKRSMVPVNEIEDIVQDAYCRLAGMTEVGHIANPRAYSSRWRAASLWTGCAVRASCAWKPWRKSTP